MLKLTSRLKIAGCVLVPLAMGAVGLAALPGAAGGGSAAQGTTAPATQPVARPDAPAAGEIVALDEKMSLWWIDPASRYRVENGELIVHNPTAEAGAFAGFIGGPSWENHHVSLDFVVERNTSPKHPDGFRFNIQIAPHNMAMFFQLMGRACNICVFTPEVNGGEFTHSPTKRRRQ